MELDSGLLHCFSAAGIPTNADECLEAGQSDLAGHSALFLKGKWEMLHCKLLKLVPVIFVCQEASTIVGQSTSLQKLAVI